LGGPDFAKHRVFHQAFSQGLDGAVFETEQDKQGGNHRRQGDDEAKGQNPFVTQVQSGEGGNELQGPGRRS
jgi:hypothetical protein